MTSDAAWLVVAVLSAASAGAWLGWFGRDRDGGGT